jgi:hypothetical protein
MLRAEQLEAVNCVVMDVIAKALEDVYAFITGILRGEGTCFCHFMTTNEQQSHFFG